MQEKSRWLRRVVTGVVAGVTTAGGLSIGLAGAAGATSSFTYTRQAGPDRYGTACAVATRAFNPNGTGSIPTVLLADGLPGHQSDALAAPFLEAQTGGGAPILLTDSTNSVPQNTMTCLTQNKVKTIIVIGGTNSVSQAQLSQLSSAGYTVQSGTYAGATRYDTMQAVDTASGTTVGTSGGSPTGILASGDDNHLVDALGAGPLAYGQKFPIVLTSSSSSTLSPQAQSVITKLGLKKLIVVGGTASIPASQYSTLSGITIDKSATTGANRGATSALLAADMVANYGGSNVFLGLAPGATYVGANPTSASPVQNDGADALSSAPLLGMAANWAASTPHAQANAGTVGSEIPLGICTNPTDCSDAANFASTETSTLSGASPAFGGPVNLPQASVNTVIQHGGGTAQTAGQVVSISPTSGNPGSTVSGQVVGPVQSLTVSGCGLTNSSITPDSNGNFSFTVPSSQPAGSCTLTFTGTPQGGGTAQTSTFTFTVNAVAGACSTAPSSATQVKGTETKLPELCSATILQTVTPTQATAAGTTPGPAGTTVQYRFSQPVTGGVFTAGGFKIYDYLDNLYIAGGAGQDPTNPYAVDAFFPQTAPTTAAKGGAGGAGSNLQSSTGAANLTLATVAGPQSAGGPAVTIPAGANPDGASAIGKASTTGAAAAGYTPAPNPVSWAITQTSGASPSYPNSTVINITFDKAAYAQGPNATLATPGYPAGYPATASTFGTPGFDVVYTTTAALANAGGTKNEQPCFGPNTGDTTTPSGGTVPGGNGTTTLTIVCPNQGGGTTPTAASKIARVIVQQGAVGTTAPGGANDVVNPLEAVPTPRTASDSPDLSSVSFIPGTNATTPDQIVYTFDQAVTLAGGQAAAPTKFAYFLSSGQQINCAGAGAAGPPATASCTATVNPSNFTQVVVTVGTPGSAAAPGANNGTLGATGAIVMFGAVNGANPPNNANADDEMGAANPNNPGTTVTPGTINAPQLLSVHVTTVTNALGTSYAVTFAFSQPVTLAANSSAGPNTGASALHLYDPDGTELTCTPGTAAVGTGTNTNTVTCSSAGGGIVQGAGGGATAATGTQITNAVLGVADYDAVVGAATTPTGAANPGSGNWNPEGGVPLS